MQDEFQLLYNVAESAGPFTAQEFLDALYSSEAKYANILKQRGGTFEILYLTRLIVEHINQNRLTDYCLMYCRNKKAANVGERVGAAKEVLPSPYFSRRGAYAQGGIF